MGGWKSIMESYMDQLIAISMRLLSLLGHAIALCDDCGQSESYDFSPYFTQPLAFLRLLHYNATVSAPGQGVFGCGAHSDYGMLTLLLTDDVPALQIFPRRATASSEVEVDDAQWVTVAPRPGGFIVNLGDMLERWSNDRYKSTLHRVVNLTGKERYSIPFFFEPNYDTLVSCLPSCVSPTYPARYEPITSGQYLTDKYTSTHSDFDEHAKDTS